MDAAHPKLCCSSCNGNRSSPRLGGSCLKGGQLRGGRGPGA